MALDVIKSVENPSGELTKQMPKSEARIKFFAILQQPNQTVSEFLEELLPLWESSSFTENVLREKIISSTTSQEVVELLKQNGTENMDELVELCRSLESTNVSDKKYVLPISQVVLDFMDPKIVQDLHKMIEDHNPFIQRILSNCDDCMEKLLANRYKIVSGVSSIVDDLKTAFENKFPEPCEIFCEGTSSYGSANSVDVAIRGKKFASLFI